MKRFATLLLTCLAAALPAQAETVVVELFASQNCAACPRAFKTLKSVSRTEDILVLTWSVDYWDYLADADPMAMPESTERQNAYVERFELRGPYTPQTVYDGAEQCPGNKKRSVKKWIDQRKDVERLPIELTVSQDSITISGELGLPREVLLVHYLADYDGDMPNPVTKVENLGNWSGGETSFPVSCDTACVVLVQEQGVGEILAMQVMP